MEHLDKCAGVSRGTCNCGYWIRLDNMNSEPHNPPPDVVTIDEWLEDNGKRTTRS